MRLHHLSMTAFGPFAGTETVDFDTLNDAGLFLLSGPTGAGKTSILDAVCFALYGCVPGVRGVKALKSQHADEQTAPEVVLEFSVRERRFRIRRSPEWTRPKRRGTGFRTENAAASLLELTGGEEQLWTSRASEVGLMVSDLVGMRAAQFQQVAMLPQGEFAQFLHASSQERHAVLQHLFRTDRFARIEEWVQDHSRDLKTKAERGEDAVRRLLHTLGERSGEALPAVDSTADVEALPSDGGLSWARQVLDDAEASSARAQVERTASETAAAALREALEVTRRESESVRRRDDARAATAALEATAAEAESAQQALDSDRRAQACLPVLGLLDRAEAAVATWEAERADAVARVAPGDAPDLATLDARDADLRDRLGRGQSLLPRAKALAELADAAERSGLLLASATEALGDTRAARDALPSELARVREAHATAARGSGRRDALVLQLDAAQERADAAHRLEESRSRLTTLRDGLRDHRDAAADARERVQQLQGRRLAEMAAELAGALRAGEPCQVCGSAAHPHPAEPAGSPVTDTEQEAAQRDLDEAQAALLAMTQRVSAADAEAAGLRETAAGLSRDEAAAVCAGLRAELGAAERAEADRVALERELATLDQALLEADASVSRCEREVAALTQRHADDRATVERSRAELEEVLPDVRAEDLPAMVERLTAELSLLSEARAAVVGHTQARERLEELTTQASDTAAAQGFASVHDVRAAVLGAPERSRLETALTQRRERAAEARSVLAAPDVAAVGDRPPPDLTVPTAELEAAEARLRECARAADLQAERVTAMTGLVDRLATTLEEWAPVRREHLRAESMSRLVRGMGADNQLQMRLSAYVLATRLDQVLDAANERLSHMRDQRYLLQRTARAARRGSQAGLGLEVVDQWTGDVRDPSTLSGGETFVVSLSLALGLADVVTQEAGGVEIETLFVDEGFGTLDPDTLDDVMDRLDGLRAGGRTVGVVSHVGELRTRIPAQVHVRKTPQGSTVHAETLVG